VRDPRGTGERHTGEGSHLERRFEEEETCTVGDHEPSTTAEPVLLMNESSHLDHPRRRRKPPPTTPMTSRRGARPMSRRRSAPGTRLGSRHGYSSTRHRGTNPPDNGGEDADAGFRETDGRESPRACDTG
jgi:hypothetical protein